MSMIVVEAGDRQFFRGGWKIMIAGDQIGFPFSKYTHREQDPDIDVNA